MLSARFVNSVCLELSWLTLISFLKIEILLVCYCLYCLSDFNIFSLFYREDMMVNLTVHFGGTMKREDGDYKYIGELGMKTVSWELYDISWAYTSVGMMKWSMKQLVFFFFFTQRKFSNNKSIYSWPIDSTQQYSKPET